MNICFVLRDRIVSTTPQGVQKESKFAARQRNEDFNFEKPLVASSSVDSPVERVFVLTRIAEAGGGLEKQLFGSSLTSISNWGNVLWIFWSAGHKLSFRGRSDAGTGRNLDHLLLCYK